MTHHEHVEPFEARQFTSEVTMEYCTIKYGFRISLSFDNVREESYKKGDSCQIYEFIWTTETVKEV